MYGPRPITDPDTVTEPSTTKSDAAVITPVTSNPAPPTDREDRPFTPPPAEKSRAGDSRAWPPKSTVPVTCNAPGGRGGEGGQMSGWWEGPGGAGVVNRQSRVYSLGRVYSKRA